MFEFHGWATIRVSYEYDVPYDPKTDRRSELEAAAIVWIRNAIDRADDHRSLFDVKTTSNGLIVLYAHGLRNHRFRPVIELFQSVSAQFPSSYGLLYVHDDEADEHGNEFRVWRLARGRFEERADPFLSPYFPTVE